MVPPTETRWEAEPLWMLWLFYINGQQCHQQHYHTSSAMLLSGKHTSSPSVHSLCISQRRGTTNLKSGLAGAKPRFLLVCFLAFHDPSSLLCVTSLPLCFLSHISVIKAWVMQAPPNSLCGGVFATWTLRGNNLGSTWSAIDCRVQSYCESRASSTYARWGCFTAPGVFFGFFCTAGNSKNVQVNGL